MELRESALFDHIRPGGDEGRHDGVIETAVDDLDAVDAYAHAQHVHAAFIPGVFRVAWGDLGDDFAKLRELITGEGPFQDEPFDLVAPLAEIIPALDPIDFEAAIEGIAEEGQATA